MITTALIEELQVPVMNNMLRHVNPGYRVVLERYHCHAELVHQQNLYYGNRFDLIRYEYAEDSRLASTPLSDRITYREVDFSRPGNDVLINAQLDFTAQEAGTVNGLKLSATTLFHGGTSFTDSYAYRYPIILPLQAFAVTAGESVSVDLGYRLCAGLGALHYSVVQGRARAE